MKKTSLAILVSLSALTGMAYAQTDSNGVVSSTDPQRVAEIQQHARQAQAQAQQQGEEGWTDTHHHVRHHRGTRHHAVKHHTVKHHAVKHHGVKHHHKKAAPAQQDQ